MRREKADAWQGILFEHLAGRRYENFHSIPHSNELRWIRYAPNVETVSILP